jgi:hypothetical protein
MPRRPPVDPTEPAGRAWAVGTDRTAPRDADSTGAGSDQMDRTSEPGIAGPNARGVDRSRREASPLREPDSSCRHQPAPTARSLRAVTAMGQLVGNGAATVVERPGRPAGPAGADADADADADGMGGTGAAALAEAAKISGTGAGVTGADGVSSSDVSTTGAEPGRPGVDGEPGFTGLPEPWPRPPIAP